MQTDGRWNRVPQACAVLASALIAYIAFLHVRMALSALSATAAGASAAKPSLPLGSVLVTWGVVGCLLAAGALVLQRAGVLRLGLPPWVASAGCGFVAVFALIMLAASLNDLADPISRWVHAPMALLLVVLVLVVMRSRKAQPAQ